MLQAGQTLQTDFTVQLVRSGRIESVRFSDLLSRRTVVSVYMRNQTPGCDSQVGSLIEKAGAIEAAGWGLIAVSRDSANSHLKYALKRGITFALLSDPADAFAKATESLVEKTLFGKKYLGPLRAAWFLGPDGTIQAVLPKVDTKRHGDQVLAQLALLGA